ncbi:unnamed protein product [Boreogadus saida]
MLLSYGHTKRVPAYDVRGIKKHVAAVAALESEVGNPNAAVCGCMIEFRSGLPAPTPRHRAVHERCCCLATRALYHEARLEDYSPESSTSAGQRGRARGRLSARGQAAIRGRGSRGGRRGARGTGGAGRSRRRGAAVNLGQDDVLRVENLQALRIADEQARIQSLDLQMSHNLLQLCLTRDPSLMFDLLTMSSADPPPSGPQE